MTLGSLTLRALPKQSFPSRLQIRTLVTGHTSHSLLARLEQSANNNPSSASSQNAFYSALLRANMPEILTERYETGRYATNQACDAMYIRALERVGQAGGAGMTMGAAGSQGFSPEQLQAVSRAVVAHGLGGTTATAITRGPTSDTGAKSSPLHVVVDESRRGYFFKLFKFVVTWSLLSYFALVVITLAIDWSGLLRGKLGGPQNAEVKPEQQTTRFSDVKGCDEAIEELQEIVDFLKSPDKYNQLGGKLPKGVLMIGPPGTGKTLLARAVAGEAGVPFFYMSGSEFDEVYVGVGAKRVRELFTNAKSKAPAIIFIDELDAVGGKRNEREASYHMQTLNQMLTELDGFDQTSGVVLIAATNFPQLLDKALTRPGRFDRQITVSLPDVRGRIDILNLHMKNMQIGTDVDAALIARGTPGFSGADLENLVNQAAVHASKQGAKKIGMSAMDWAKDRIIMGAEKKSQVIQEKDKVMTAYHEAGHALVAMFTDGADPLYKCTIMPRGQALGVTHYMPELDKVSMAKMEYMAWIDIAMGGKIAEELVYGADKVTSGCSSDLTKATDIAYSMVTQYGMSDALGSIAFDGKLYQSLSSETKQKIEDEVRRFLDEGQARARELLRTKRKELDMLAQALIKYETLNKDEMEKVVRGERLPEKMSTLPGAPIKMPDISIQEAGDALRGISRPPGNGEIDGEVPPGPITAGR